MTVAAPPRATGAVDQRPHAQRQEKTPTRTPHRRKRSTPRVLRSMLIGLVTLSLVVGAVCTLLVLKREQRLDQLATTDGELHAAAEQFYRSLSTADVAASAAFLARDVGMATDRVRYETEYEAAAGEAQSALARLVAASDEDTDSRQRDLLGTLPGRLSEYTVLVEQARAYNRLHEPVASTYQLLAADAMAANLLPAGQKLYDSVIERLTDNQRAATEPPWVELTLGGVLLVALIGAQVYVWRRSRRVFNIGLLVATVAAVSMVGWIALSHFTASSRAERSHSEGTEVINTVTQARNTGLAARANEALIPVATRDDHSFAEYESSFQHMMQQLTGDDGRLAAAKAVSTDGSARAAVDDALAAARSWNNTHAAVQQAAASGDQKKAVRALIASQGAAAFESFDDALAGIVDDVRLRFESAADEARAALTGVLIGVISLALLAAAGGAFGVWQRLREYR